MIDLMLENNVAALALTHGTYEEGPPTIAEAAEEATKAADEETKDVHMEAAPEGEADAGLDGEAVAADTANAGPEGEAVASDSKDAEAHAGSALAASRVPEKLPAPSADSRRWSSAAR